MLNNLKRSVFFQEDSVQQPIWIVPVLTLLLVKAQYLFKGGQQHQQRATVKSSSSYNTIQWQNAIIKIMEKKYNKKDTKSEC